MEGVHKTRLVILHSWSCDTVVPSLFTMWVFFSAEITLSFSIPEQTHWGKSNFLVTFHSRTMQQKDKNLRNSLKRFTIMVNGLEAPNWKTNAICFSFCKQNGRKNNASSASFVSNPTKQVCEWFEFGDRVGRREVCKVLRLQASCTQLGETLENTIYIIKHMFEYCTCTVL